MDDDKTDLQIRKFLRRVGIESHSAIRAAIEAADGDLVVKMQLTVGDDPTPVKVFDATIEAG
jgi:hypothetical protein